MWVGSFLVTMLVILDQGHAATKAAKILYVPVKSWKPLF